MTDLAVLLCAGGATRLRPLTDERPKALLDVGGETILARAVRLLLEHGVRELVIATGYRDDAVRAALAGSAARVNFCHNPRFASTQNSVSLHLCASAIAGRAFFKLDGDVLFHRAVLTRLDADLGALSVAVDRKANLGDEEMKVVAEANVIRAFGKKLDPALCAGESIGIERIDASFGQDLFAALAAASSRGQTDVYYEDIYSELVARGADARVVDVSDLPWIEIDTPEDLAAARQAIAQRKLDRSA